MCTSVAAFRETDGWKDSLLPKEPLAGVDWSPYHHNHLAMADLGALKNQIDDKTLSSYCLFFCFSAVACLESISAISTRLAKAAAADLKVTALMLDKCSSGVFQV